MQNRKVNSFDFMIKNKNIYRKEETLMAQLWGGRFTKETDQLVYNFNASISFDQKFLVKSRFFRMTDKQVLY